MDKLFQKLQSMVSVDGYRNDISHACEPKGQHTDQDLDPELDVNSHHVQSRNDQGSILIQSDQNSAQAGFDGQNITQPL